MSSQKVTPNSMIGRISMRIMKHETLTSQMSSTLERVNSFKYLQGILFKPNLSWLSLLSETFVKRLRRCLG